MVGVVQLSRYLAARDAVSEWRDDRPEGHLPHPCPSAG